MNCRERADNISKCKQTDYFKPSNNKNVRKDVDSNEPIIETTTSIVCIGYQRSLPPQKHPPSCPTPLKSAGCLSPPPPL